MPLLNVNRCKHEYSSRKEGQLPSSTGYWILNNNAIKNIKADKYVSTLIVIVIVMIILIILMVIMMIVNIPKRLEIAGTDIILFIIIGKEFIEVMVLK